MLTTQNPEAFSKSGSLPLYGWPTSYYMWNSSQVEYKISKNLYKIKPKFLFCQKREYIIKATHATIYSNKLSTQKYGLTIHKKKSWANLVASCPLWDLFMTASSFY